MTEHRSGWQRKGHSKSLKLKGYKVRIGVNGGKILDFSWLLESWHQPMINLVLVESLEKEKL